LGGAVRVVAAEERDREEGFMARNSQDEGIKERKVTAND